MDLSSINTPQLPRITLDSESAEIKAINEFCLSNNLLSISALPIVAALIARHSGPDLNGVIYPSHIGDLYSVGGHEIRVRYISLQLHSSLIYTFLPKEKVHAPFLSELTSLALGHDHGKTSVRDKTRLNMRFKDEVEKRSIVEDHTLLVPPLWRLLMRSLIGKSDLNRILVSGTDERIPFESDRIRKPVTGLTDSDRELIKQLRNERRAHQLSIYYGSMLHHVTFEGYPNIDFLVQQKRIPLIVSQIIVQHLFDMKHHPLEAIKRLLSENPWERAIANALMILSISDILDGIFSDRPHYHTYKMRNRTDRFNDFSKMLHGALAPSLAEFFYQKAAEIYSDPQNLHRMSMVNFHYLVKKTILDPLRPIWIPELIHSSIEDFILHAQTIEPIDYSVEFDAAIVNGH